MEAVNCEVGRRSMLISVLNYTLTADGEVKVAELGKLWGSPFLSYVSETDTVATLAARLGIIAGDPESVWPTYKLAIIRDSVQAKLKVRCNLNDVVFGSNRPFEVSDKEMPAIRCVDAWGFGSEEPPAQTFLWDNFKEAFPIQTSKSLFDVTYDQNVTRKFPLVGILRSSNALPNMATAVDTNFSSSYVPPRFV